MFVLKLKLMAECVGNSLKNADSLLGNFWADAVTGKNSDIQEHAEVSLMEGLSQCTVI
jgi:hypothetical protein